MAAQKTNALRLLDKEGIKYETHEYDTSDGAIDGSSVADKVGKSREMVFKTLVTVGASKQNYVFAVPVEKELDLKAAARVVGEKSIAMIKVAEIEKLTGYIRGGCSPVGMKKPFRTVIDQSVSGLASVVVSAGKIGLQMELSPVDLIRACKGEAAEITTEHA